MITWLVTYPTKARAATRTTVEPNIVESIDTEPVPDKLYIVTELRGFPHMGFPLMGFPLNSNFGYHGYIYNVSNYITLYQWKLCC